MSVAAHVAECVARHGDRGPVALVTRQVGMLGAGQAYAFDTARHGLNVEVFWDFDDAAAWLDRQLGIQSE